MRPILSVEDLHVEFHTYAGTVHAVNGVDFHLNAGETIGIVGESGSGKSVTLNALMGLIPSPPGKVTAGKADFQGQDLLSMPENQLRKIRGNSISMIFQDPMTSLNPVLTIGFQLQEPLLIHRSMSAREAKEQAISLLNQVGISDPEVRLKQYPHQLSGGMRQRVMIAMALACEPIILFADEPTTALDVTVQAQIIDLLKKLNREMNMAIVLITHDLGVVAGLCSRVLVMYAGQLVESSPVESLYSQPLHPYTFSLLRSLPLTSSAGKRLHVIEGQPPDLFSLPQGCSFFPRCQFALDICETEPPPLFPLPGERLSRCWLNHPHSSVRVDRLLQMEVVE